MPKTQTEKDIQKKSTGPVGVNPPEPTPAKPTPEITPKPKLSVDDNFSQQRANAQNVVKDSLKGIVSEEADLTRRMTPTPKKPTPILQGVNSFPDINAKGFILNKNGSRDTDFIIGSNEITKTNILDQKGDFSIEPYTAQNKAEPIRKELGQKTFDTNKFRGEISFPKNNKKDSRGNVILPFNENRTAPNTKDEPIPSRLLLKHTENNFLDNLYAQAKGKGILGYRNNDRVGFDEPFVIKDVDDRWGFGGVEQIPGFKNNTIAKVLDFAGEMLDDIGGAVLGRAPNEYIGNAVGSLERTGKFLITPEGIGFLAKQGILQRRNAQKLRTDVRYGIQKSELSRFVNPRLYNPLSLGSLPGVTKISINAPDPTLPFDSLKSEITDYVSDEIKKKSQEIKGKLVKKISEVGNKIGNKLIAKSPLGNIREKAKKLSLNVQEKVEGFNDVLEAEGIDVSKLLGQKLDNQAFADVGVDKVNLIPYGYKPGTEGLPKAAYKGKTERELDFCPFRFEDSNGKIIVFRAILSGITDTFTPEYASERYVGRPDNVYVYQGTTREISFTFDIYPKSAGELLPLWEKMNYLAGLTYPEFAPVNGGGQGMVAPFTKLTIGDMYKNTPGYISGLTYTIMDEGTWELDLAQVPKYIQAACTFVYIGDRLPHSTQKLYDVNWVPEVEIEGQSLTDKAADKIVDILTGGFSKKNIGAQGS